MKILQIVNREENKGFGIRVEHEGAEIWVNAFEGLCPEEYEVGMEVDIPHHVVQKGDRTYYNFGERKASKLDQLTERVEKLEQAVAKMMSD